MSTKISAVIPARLASQRFPRKVLHLFHGLPMIEHVRRRALMCPSIGEVVVATCDPEVADVVRGFGGAVVMTSDRHRNGTDRVAEAVRSMDCSHVLVVQGDEPLIVPEEIEKAVRLIQSNPGRKVWNATTPLDNESDLDNRSIVKCVVSAGGKILLMSRRTPSISAFQAQMVFLRKVSGFIAFERETLQWISSAPASPFEVAESIEQMRMIENDIAIYEIPFARAFPSVNLPEEATEVEEAIRTDSYQSGMVDRVLSQVSGRS